MGEILNPTTVLAEAEAPVAISTLGLLAYVAFVLVILVALMQYAKRDLGQRVFKNWATQCFEQLYLFVENLCVGIIGQHGTYYIPMIMTYWMVIFVSNVVGLFMPFTPTASLSFNLGMALIAVGYVQYEGIRANGLFGHLKHFKGPALSGVMVLVSGIIFIIEIVSEIMKNVSLSLRLYGNIHGGHEAVLAMNNLGKPWFPIGALLLPIKLLTCVVQALVFSLLTCVYISLVTAHHDDHAHEGGQGSAVPAH